MIAVVFYHKWVLSETNFNGSLFIFIVISEKFLQEHLCGPILKSKCFVDQSSSIPPLGFCNIQNSEFNWQNADETCFAADGASNLEFRVIL